MKAAVLMSIVGALLLIPEKVGLVDASGDFLTPTPEQYGQVVAAVNGILLAHGVTEPAKLKKALAMVPMILELSA